MKSYLITNPHGSAQRLLIFFNGWAMNEAAIRPLALPEGYDLLLIEDYRDDELHLPAELLDKNPYQGYDLIAWSMGVWAATRAGQLGLLPVIDKAIAIGGTPIVYDNKYGIPHSIFWGTLEGLDESSRERFNRRMCGGKRLKPLFDALAARSGEEIRSELARAGSVEQPIRAAIPPHPLVWSCGVVPAKDRIVPPANQHAYWRLYGAKRVQLREGDHYIFDQFASWSELLAIDETHGADC